MYVIGTAGHVDHGKSTLVHALTGIDPDRLQVEKDRQMTVDLGFAWLRLPNGQEVSIVDVPGHERFIKNMLAGVGGIDLALLVVAADEGVMPQTREHLAILDILRVERGIVTITKSELVDNDWLELVRADIAEVLKGTSLEDAPMVPVSSFTGQGFPELIATVQKTLQELPPKRDVGRPRLPVDRAFSIAGFGTVVTGTLIDGKLTVGQEVELVPGGRECRIRGIQTHKKKLEDAAPGTRVAVNLSGIAPEDIHRGQVLTTRGWLKPTIALDARLKVVASYPSPLAHHAAVTFHSGTAESTARVRLLESSEVQSGESTWVQIRLDQPLPLVKDDYFIIRSTWGTAGGGQVVEPFAKRHRRFHPVVLERLEVMEEGNPVEITLKALEQAEPCDMKALVPLTHLSQSETLSALHALIEQRRALTLGNSPLSTTALLYSQAGWQQLAEEVRDLLANYHSQFPVRRGIPKEELRSRLGLAPAAFTQVMQGLQVEGHLSEDGAFVRLPGHEPTLSPEQARRVEGYLRALRSNPYAPPNDSAPDADILSLLLDQRKIVKVSDDLVFAAEAYDTMVQQVVDLIQARGKITLAEVRDHFGTSRKYAQALMEYLDQQHITRRVGDERVLR